MVWGKVLWPTLLEGGLLPLYLSNIIWCVYLILYETLRSYPLVWNLSKNDFKVRYVGSYLGIFWAFINPLVTILLYWTVFQFAFNNSDVDGFPFVLWLVAGLVHRGFDSRFH